MWDDTLYRYPSDSYSIYSYDEEESEKSLNMAHYFLEEDQQPNIIRKREITPWKELLRTQPPQLYSFNYGFENPY